MRATTALPVLGAVALALATACGSPAPERSSAFPITSRSQLVGGARALGEGEGARGLEDRVESLQHRVISEGYLVDK